MSTFKVTPTISLENPVEWDLHLLNGNLVLIDDDEAIAQAIKSRLQFFKGEWFLDAREGTPYFEEVFIKNPDIDLLRTIFKEVISGSDGVQDVPRLEIEVDGPTRVMTLDFEARLVDGGTILSRDFAPFIVQIPGSEEKPE